MEENINTMIQKVIYLIITFIYIAIIVIIFLNSIYSILLSFQSKKKNTNRNNNSYVNNSKIVIEEAISYSLSLVLATEILRLLYIKTFNSLLFIGSIILLKLILNFFVKKDLEEEYKKE